MGMIPRKRIGVANDHWQHMCICMVNHGFMHQTRIISSDIKMILIVFLINSHCSHYELSLAASIHYHPISIEYVAKRMPKVDESKLKVLFQENLFENVP